MKPAEVAPRKNERVSWRMRELWEWGGGGWGVGRERGEQRSVKECVRSSRSVRRRSKSSQLKTKDAGAGR